MLLLPLFVPLAAALYDLGIFDAMLLLLGHNPIITTVLLASLLVYVSLPRIQRWTRRQRLLNLIRRLILEFYSAKPCFDKFPEISPEVRERYEDETFRKQYTEARPQTGKKKYASFCKKYAGFVFGLEEANLAIAYAFDIWLLIRLNTHYRRQGKKFFVSMINDGDPTTTPVNDAKFTESYINLYEIAHQILNEHEVTAYTYAVKFTNDMPKMKKYWNKISKQGTTRMYSPTREFPDYYNAGSLDVIAHTCKLTQFVNPPSPKCLGVIEAFPESDKLPKLPDDVNEWEVLGRCTSVSVVDDTLHQALLRQQGKDPTEVDREGGITYFGAGPTSEKEMAFVRDQFPPSKLVVSLLPVGSRIIKKNGKYDQDIPMKDGLLAQNSSLAKSSTTLYSVIDS